MNKREDIEINIDVEEELLRLNHDDKYRKLQDLYQNTTFFNMIGKQRDENIHSNFLQWIFNQSGRFQNWKDSPLMHLLDIIIRRAKEQDKEIDEKILSETLTRNKRIDLDSAEREVHTKGIELNITKNKKSRQKSGSIDLLLTCTSASGYKFDICIENKVDTKEHDNQTWKYWAYLTGESIPSEFGEIVRDNDVYVKSEIDKHIFVYLSPISDYELEHNKSKVSCKHYISINYQDILSYILQPILESKELDERSNIFIQEYINTLCIFNDDTIMAITEEQNQLLRDFLDENEKLILAALQARMGTSDSDEERSNIQEVMNSFKDIKQIDFNKLGIVGQTFTYTVDSNIKVIAVDNRHVTTTDDTYILLDQNIKEWINNQPTIDYKSKDVHVFSLTGLVKQIQPEVKNLRGPAFWKTWDGQKLSELWDNRKSNL